MDTLDPFVPIAPLVPELTQEEVDAQFREMIEYIGPTWQKDEETGNFLLPERTLGWECIAWVMENMRAGDIGREEEPFVFTPEQTRWILWWYAIDFEGKFIYDEGQLQRLKGWGKDPLISMLCAFEGLGPCRFGGWADTWGYTPIGVAEPQALVQIAAVTQEQTDTTMRLFKHYFSKDAVKKYRIEINTETVKTWGTVAIKSVTSNPDALEGRSNTFSVINEPHHWHTELSKQMHKVISRNAVKVKGGTSRILAITNAYDPGQRSVAQETRELYFLQLSQMGESRILYDSVEVSPETPVFIYVKDATGYDTTELDVEATKFHITKLVELVRGDSWWCPVDRIINEFFDVRNPVDLSKRFWWNAIVSSEDNWIDLRDYDACVTATKAQGTKVLPGDKIVMFFDGSKNSDSTVLVGCRISDGFLFNIQAWHKPRKGMGPAGTVWLVPRNERDKKKYDFTDDRYMNPYRNVPTVDEAVENAFRRYDVLGFFADPSHARDDIDNKVYWDEAIEKWHIKYSDRLKVWAGNQRGSKSQSINWDMSDPTKIEQFAERAEMTADSIMRHELLISDDPDFRIHFSHAKIYKTRGGLESIWKGRRNSDKKIDLAVGCIGALFVRAQYMKQHGAIRPRYNPLNRF